MVHSKVIWRNWYALTQSLGTSNLSSCTILVLRIYTARFARYSYHLPRRFLPLFSSFSNFTTTLRPAVALPSAKHNSTSTSRLSPAVGISSSPHQHLFSLTAQRRKILLCAHSYFGTITSDVWRHFSSVATPYDTAVTSRVATPLPPYSAPPHRLPVTWSYNEQLTFSCLVVIVECWKGRRWIFLNWNTVIDNKTSEDIFWTKYILNL